MDPVFLAINTVRGQAIEAVNNYALWTYRNLDDAGRAEGFERMPNVRSSSIAILIEAWRRPTRFTPFMGESFLGCSYWMRRGRVRTSQGSFLQPKLRASTGSFRGMPTSRSVLHTTRCSMFFGKSTAVP